MFKAVRHGDGRVLAFTLDFQSGTSLADAESAVTRQLPSDATSGPLMAPRDCWLWSFTSPTLARLLAASPIVDTTGMVGVQFNSGAHIINTDSITTAVMTIAADASGAGCSYP
jgi:hypothetical protein